MFVYTTDSFKSYPIRLEVVGIVTFCLYVLYIAEFNINLHESEQVNEEAPDQFVRNHAVSTMHFIYHLDNVIRLRLCSIQSSGFR